MYVSCLCTRTFEPSTHSVRAPLLPIDFTHRSRTHTHTHIHTPARIFFSDCCLWRRGKRAGRRTRAATAEHRQRGTRLCLLPCPRCVDVCGCIWACVCVGVWVWVCMCTSAYNIRKHGTLAPSFTQHETRSHGLSHTHRPGVCDEQHHHEHHDQHLRARSCATREAERCGC